MPDTGGTGRAGTDDAELAALEQELRMAAGLLDPVPPGLVEQAVAGFTWRTVDAELAELVYDSAADREPAGVRGGDQPRLLTFRTDRLSIEVELAGAGGGPAELVGQLIPAQPAEVELQQAGQQLPVSTDQLGRFTVTPPASGPLRLHCRPPAGRPVVTDWFTG